MASGQAQVCTANAQSRWAGASQLFTSIVMIAPVGRLRLTLKSAWLSLLTVVLLLQSFMASGRAQADFQPMPLPQLRLSVQDQCRLRDRSTIMARQMYAGQGSQYADAQVRTTNS